MGGTATLTGVVLYLFTAAGLGVALVVLTVIRWWLVARKGPWAKLARRYPRTHACSGQRWRQQSVRIRSAASADSLVTPRTTVGTDEHGLYLGRSLWWGAIVMPPIQIPWPALTPTADGFNVDGEHHIKLDQLLRQQLSSK
jgi:hypothetical protein